MKLKKEAEDFVSCPGAWILNRVFKGGKMNTKMVYSLIKHFDHEGVKTEIKAEWAKTTKIMITQEEKAAERELE